MSSDSRSEPQAAEERLVLVGLLAALAGFVDAVSYFRFSGLFVLFMSGNSTSLAAAAAKQDLSSATNLILALVAFVGGVVVGEVLRLNRRAIVILVEACFLTAAAAFSVLREPVAVAMLACAMGLQNTSLHRANEIALTYVTGTLVHIGRGVVSAARGEKRWKDILPHLSLWISFVAGAVAGAFSAARSAIHAFYGAAGAAFVLSGILLLIDLAASKQPTKKKL